MIYNSRDFLDNFVDKFGFIPDNEKETVNELDFSHEKIFEHNLVRIFFLL